MLPRALLFLLTVFPRRTSRADEALHNSPSLRLLPSSVATALHLAAELVVGIWQHIAFLSFCIEKAHSASQQ